MKNINDFSRRNSCRLCGSHNIEFIMHMGSTPVGDDFVSLDRLDKIQNEYPLDLYFCQDCGLLQLTGVINPEAIYREYIYETSGSLGLKMHFQNYADELILRKTPRQGSLVIDIGSNDGTLLRAFQGLGMRVLGIEPAHNIAKKVSASGIETLPCFFTAELAKEIKKDHGPAAVITANNVVANIDDLSELTSGIKELLDKDGVFVFETGYMIDTIQNLVIDNVYHEHLSYFSVKPLVKYFTSCNLEIIDVQRVPTKGGSIRCTVQRAGGPGTISPSVTGLLALETELGFDRISPFSVFVKRAEYMKKELINRLEDIRRQGKTIAGYGASVGVTTLLYYLELKDSLSYLLDDNRARHNLYSPGLHIPVLPSEVIYERKPDFLLILAWRYAEPIIRKHRKYLDQNGHMITLLPQVEVI